MEQTKAERGLEAAHGFADCRGAAASGSRRFAEATGPRDGKRKEGHESGRYGSAAELAVAEKINPSYVSRVLRLTLLAPDIIEASVEGRQDVVEVDFMLKPFLGQLGRAARDLCLNIMTILRPMAAMRLRLL